MALQDSNVARLVGKLKLKREPALMQYCFCNTQIISKTLKKYQHMSNNTDLKQAFIAQSSIILANEKSMSAVDALTYAYNSETFRRLIDGRLASLSLEELLELFKEETIQGKLS